jgi:tRNA(Ile2) C34 agmatinyltransferase TiaS
VGDDFSFAILDKGVRHPIEPCVFAHQSVDGQQISSGHGSRGGIAEVVCHNQYSLIELIAQRVLSQLVHGGNDKQT